MIDGGPAFARPVSEDQPHGNKTIPDQEGMSLRDYFAAHAPAEPQGWFTPIIGPRPNAQWPEGVPGSQREVPINQSELNEYDTQWQKAYYSQWPWAWADAMLFARTKSKPPD